MTAGQLLVLLQTYVEATNEDMSYAAVSKHVDYLYKRGLTNGIGDLRNLGHNFVAELMARVNQDD